MKLNPLILIVDDIEYNLILLNSILENSGYRVLSAMSGKKCLEILNTELPDIILLDVNMPEMNGFDIADKIKSNERTKEIPILFLSALSDYDTKLIGLEKGAVDYITKPYDDREVIARIQIHLKIKELEKERIEHIQQLEDLNRDKENLLQLIAHDMRSPLTSILLMAEFLREEKVNLNFSKIMKYSTTIFNSSKKILNLINQLLKANKIESSKNEITEFNLVKAVLQYKELLNPFLERKSLTLDMEFCQKEISVKLDEVKLDQILNNIIYNSIKFSRSGGRILVKTDFIVEGDSKAIYISISDTGIGIPKNTKDLIFSKKANYHRLGTNGEEGNGLGLTITKNLMNQLHGKIEIESEEDVGTTVHLYFYSY